MSSKPTRPCCEASFMVKFLGKRDHAKKFLSGAMLARRLKYFKDLEDDPARSDRSGPQFSDSVVRWNLRQ